MKNWILLLSFVFCLVSNAAVAPGSGSGRGNAASLQGVSISATAPTNTQVLTYNATRANWEPAAGGAGGGATYTANQYGLAVSDATNATFSVIAPSSSATASLISGGAAANPIWIEQGSKTIQNCSITIICRG
jgi:hypothetical protein